MEVYRRSSWLLLLLGLSLLATTLQGVQGEAETDGPSESECRPYIEKALKELETGEAVDPGAPIDGDSKEDIPTVEITTDDSDHEDGDGDDDADVEGRSSTESIETDEGAETTPDEQADEGKSSEEEEKVKSEEGADDEKEEKSNEDVSREKDDNKSEEDGKESTEDQRESEETKEESTEDKESIEEVKATDEDSKDQEEATDENAESTEEKKEESKEADSKHASNEAESKEDGSKEESKEEDDKQSQEDEEVIEDQEGDNSKKTDDSKDFESQEIDKGSKEGENEEESQENGKQENSKEVDDSKENSKVDSTEDSHGESKEEEKSVENKSEGKDDSLEAQHDDKESKEDSKGDSKEDVKDNSKEDVKDDSKKDVKDDSKEDVKDDSKEDIKSHSKRDVQGDSKEDVKEDSKEDIKSDSKEDVKDDSKEDIKGDSEEYLKDKKEDDSKENDKVDSKEKVADESNEDVEKDSVENESAPEEDLSEDIEIPENLRPSHHITQLLKLDEGSFETDRIVNRVSEITLRELKKLYENAIKPLEGLYKYRDLSNRHFGDSEIFSKPLVLFMGPWSGGKSSIINYLLNNEYNETTLRTGAEPSPAYFNILMHGDDPEVLDGTQLAADYTFSGLQKFGQGLEERLRGLKLPSKLLEKINIVEIPGILEVRKQVSRMFPFNDACQWFIDRADIIFLVYDPSKLDVGPETEAILDQLKGREYQTRIILNKADQVKPEELMRVQGALIWNISPLMSSAQPPIMYTTSLWSRPYEAGAPVRLLQAQERAFLRDLRSAVDKRIDHKISSARRFAVRVRNHAKMVDCYLTTYYNHKSVFGNRKQVSDQIIEHPQNYHIYEGLSTLTNISRYDLPDPDIYRDFFKLNPLYDFQQLSSTCTYFRGCPINRLDVAIAYDLPELVGKHKRLVEAALVEANKAQTPGS